MVRSSFGNVRFGSEADIEARPRDVRFTPESRHQGRILKLVIPGEVAVMSALPPLCHKQTHALQQSMPGLGEILPDFRQ